MRFGPVRLNLHSGSEMDGPNTVHYHGITFNNPPNWKTPGKKYENLAEALMNTF